MRKRLNLWFALAPLLFTSTAFAQAHFVTGNSNCGTTTVSTTFSDSSNGLASDTATGRKSNCTAMVAGKADGGYAGVSVLLTGGSGATYMGRVLALSDYQLMISAPPSYTGGPVPVQFAFRVHGVAGTFASSSSVAARSTFTHASLGLRVFINGSDVLGYGDSASSLVQPGVGAILEPITDSTTVGEALVTSVYNASLNAPLNLGLEFIGNASVSVGADGSGSAGVDAMNTLSFDPLLAVILPDGFSITSPEANIVNNIWTDPRPVPIPPAMVLMLSAMFVALRKRAIG